MHQALEDTLTKHCIKFSLLETLWGPRYDHFWMSCWPSHSQYWIFGRICENMEVYARI